MVGVKRKCSTLQHVLEMANCLEGSKQLPVVRGPELLVGFELGRIEGQGLPALGPSLLQYPADGEVRSVGGQGQGCAWPGMKEEGGAGQGFLDCLERGLAVGSPFEAFRLALESLEKMVHVRCCLRDKLAIVPYHPEKPL